MAYTDKQIETIFKEICKQMSEDGKSLRKVLRQENMPYSEVFYKWIDNDEEKTKQYASACSKRADVIFEEIITIADKQGKDIIKVDGKEITNHNVINRSRLMVDARKWILSKMNPKKYGEASLLKIGNPDGTELKINAIFTKDIMNVPPDDSAEEDSKP